MNDCEECAYLRAERAGMYLSDGAPLEVADRAAQRERCSNHPYTQMDLFNELADRTRKVLRCPTFYEQTRREGYPSADHIPTPERPLCP